MGVAVTVVTRLVDSVECAVAFVNEEYAVVMEEKELVLMELVELKSATAKSWALTFFCWRCSSLAPF